MAYRGSAYSCRIVGRPCNQGYLKDGAPLDAACERTLAAGGKHRGSKGVGGSRCNLECTGSRFQLIFAG